jgi:hypothetical protein
MLSEIRTGTCTQETEVRLQQTSKRTFSGGIEPTVLTTHRGDVDANNKQKLDSLPGNEHLFNAIDTGLTDSEKASCQAPTKLILKIGCVFAWCLRGTATD